MFYADMLKINPAKPSIRLYKPDDTRKLCSFILSGNKAGVLNINVKEDPNGSGYRFIAELRNNIGKLLGFEHYAQFDKTDYMTGLLINVIPEYRRNNYFLGEILRLTSIIQMLENNIKTFSIKSKDSAIYFHSKYKFQPSVISFYDRDKLLETITQDTSPKFKDITLKGKELTEKIKYTLSTEKQRTFTQEANTLFAEYINRAMTENNSHLHQFHWLMDMALEQKTVLKNKEFFNSLFDKHGIDYKI